jgi:hypothetical protein
MKQLPLLKYNDLWRVMCLDHRNNLNGVVVDDASLEIMLHIEKTMQRLEVMGDDEQRVLWIEIKAPAKKYREEDSDANGNYWYQLCTGHYKDFHYLILSNREWRFIDLRSAHHIDAERKPDLYSGNVSKALKKIDIYISALVDSICENPDAYNAYINEHLPYTKRDGKIKRADLNRICPSYKTFNNPEHVKRVLEKQYSMPLWTSNEMTLRKYMHIWRIAYEAYCTKSRFDPEPKSAYKNVSDEDIFRHNSKGREIEGLNLDSEEDFLKWESANSPYHCLDVAYARVHLSPHKKGEGWDDEEIPVLEGHWYFSLYFSVYGYSQDVINMLEAFCHAGIGVVCGATSRLLKMVNETDYVSISSIPNKYTHDEEIGNEISLPYECEDITAQQVAEVIAATEWVPLKKVKPVL